jgi:hypothetical protein
MAKEIVDVETLSCGCVLTRQIIDGEKQFQIEACERSCVNLRAALNLGQQKGIPIEMREL